jgi:hypothetical protein
MTISKVRLSLLLITSKSGTTALPISEGHDFGYIPLAFPPHI